MAKTRTAFFCQQCGAQSARWIGHCPSCGEWNTYIEEVIQRKDEAKGEVPAFLKKPAVPRLLKDIERKDDDRKETLDKEFNRVLGGGLVPGSLVLIGGEPGIGKSTLLLQIILQMPGLKALYITGEESLQQIRMRAQRLGKENPSCYILNETSTQEIFVHIEKLNPELVIIDSVQTLHTQAIDSAPGSISQVRECAAEFQRYAKLTGTPVVLIGHITKEGYIAGPKVLEHMVDTVLQFEGDRDFVYRIIRSIKNRYGSTSELGMYEMRDNGLREVTNPSEILLSQREDELPGIAVAVMIEGIRPMLVETQALVSSSIYGTPQRSSTGFDIKRLHMLLAVLEKRGGARLGLKDVFLNITGGIKVEDPAIDLAVAAAILSSHEDITVPKNYCFAAEVGLSGEVRAVNRIEQRILEAQKQGYTKIFISKYSLKGIDKGKYKIALHTISNINEMLPAISSKSRDHK